MAARHRLSPAQLPFLSGATLPWLPALVGIGIAVGFTIYAAAPSVDDPQLDDQPAFEVPSDVPDPVVSGSPSPTPPASTAPPSSPPPSTPPPSSHPPPPTHPPPPDVVGTYRLLASFDHEFIGKVVIENNSGHAQDWTVQLAFPFNVGKVLDFWLDGEWQPEGRRLEDNSVLFTSTAPVGAHSHVVLKVRFQRSGHDVDPDLCKVNGAHCVYH